MARNFNSKNTTQPTRTRAFYRALYKSEAYPENGGLGEPMIKDFNFIERLHYGLIDHKNNSVIPNSSFMSYVSNTDGSTAQVFDFVADAVSNTRLNLLAAVDKGLITTEASAIANLQLNKSYVNPQIDYEKYLRQIFNIYNLNYIPNVLRISSITSYENYVNNFFKFVLQNFVNTPITMTRYNTSVESSILNSGLAFSYADIPYDDDQRKIDEIIDHPSFPYVKNLCLNMGFSIAHNNPNILVFDISSPATEAYRSRLGLFNLDILFEQRFIKTYTLDLSLLYNNINIYYNEFVLRNPMTKVVSVNERCGKTVSEFIQLEPVSLITRPHSDIRELDMYIKVRNLEENRPFSDQKLKTILHKAKFFLKKLDKMAATEYINNMFRDQVWNKNGGYDDLLKNLRGSTSKSVRGSTRGESPTAPSTPSGGSYGGGSSGGGSSSGY